LDLQLCGDKFTASARCIAYGEFQHWNGQYTHQATGPGGNVIAEMRRAMKEVPEDIPVPPWQELTHSTIIADPSEQGSGIPEALQEKGVHIVFEDIGSGCYMVVFGFFLHLARRVPYEEVMTANETRNLKALLPPIPALGVHELSLLIEDSPRPPSIPPGLFDLTAALHTGGIQPWWVEDTNEIAALLSGAAMVSKPLYALEREPPLFSPDGKLPFHLRPPRKKKSRTPAQIQIDLVQGFLGVDVTCAERLLRRFQSVKGVMFAEIEELLEDEDVGWMQIHHRWEMMRAPMTAQ